MNHGDARPSTLLSRAAPREPLQAAIVDLDGTLVDTLGDFVAALDAMLAELALPAAVPAAVALAIGRGSDHLVRRTLADAGADADDDALFDAALAAYRRHYERVNGAHSSVYPGAAEGLDRLAAHGLKLACLTNKPTAWAEALLAAKGLRGRFAFVFGGDAFERRKPDPLPVLAACAALGSVPARTLVVGDSSNDAAAARAAGCPVVLVAHGYNHGRPAAEAGADAVVDRLDAVPLW